MSSLRIVGVSGGLGRPSRTTFLVRSVLRALQSLTAADAQLIEVARVGPLLGQYTQRVDMPPEAEALLAQVEAADIIVAGTPVYKGAYTGQFKHLFDMLDPNALVDVPIVLAATGGSDRHCLMTDHTLRPLFSFFRAHTVPTALYATAAQIDDDRILDAGLSERVALAARQALRLLRAPAHAPAPAANIQPNPIAQ